MSRPRPVMARTTTLSAMPARTSPRPRLLLHLHPSADETRANTAIASNGRRELQAQSRPHHTFSGSTPHLRRWTGSLVNTPDPARMDSSTANLLRVVLDRQKDHCWRLSDVSPATKNQQPSKAAGFVEACCGIQYFA